MVELGDRNLLRKGELYGDLVVIIRSVIFRNILKTGEYEKKDRFLRKKNI